MVDYLQAFELRFKEFLRKSSGPTNKPPPLPSLRLRPDDPEYYNDLPGKEPPGSGNNQHSTATLPMTDQYNSNLIDLSTELSGNY